jgi:hypothetical protein
MSPISSGDNRVDGRKADAKTSSERRLALASNHPAIDLLDLGFGQLGRRSALSSGDAAIPSGIVDILLPRTISEIRDGIVELVVIEVTNFHPFGTRPDEGCREDDVDREEFLFAVIGDEAVDDVSLRPDASLQLPPASIPLAGANNCI